MNTLSPFVAVVLAAGKGTRMKSSRAKVLHEVFFRPMIEHVLNAVNPMGPQQTIVIVGHQRQAVEQAIAGSQVTCVEQQQQNGTGHAVLCAAPLLADFTGTVMILCGDAPLLQTSHLREMLEQHAAGGTKLTIMTTTLDNPTNYGRVLCDEDGALREIVEEKDATPEQRQIKVINAGIYCAESDFLFTALQQVTTNNSQGEMYLTDIVGIAVKSGLTVATYNHPIPVQVLGVNSRVELAQAHAELQLRRNHDLLAAGVTMHDPASVTVGPDVTVGSDCCFAGRLSITGTSTIGTGCRIEPGAFLDSVSLGRNVHIGANSVLRHCSIGDDSVIPPLTLREGTDSNR